MSIIKNTQSRSRKLLSTILTVFMIITCACALAGAASSIPKSDYLSPVNLVANSNGRILYITEYTGQKIAVFDVKSNKVLKEISIEGRPIDLAINKDDSLLYVTDGEPEGKIHVIDTKRNKEIKTFNVGHTPMSPVISSDGKKLYICNRFNNNVEVLDAISGKELAIIPVTREPVASVLTFDGKFLFVANHLPKGSANVDYMTSVIDVIDTSANKICKSIKLPNGAIDLRAITITRDGQYILVPSILARFMVPTTQIERGWMNTHALNIIDVANQKLFHTILLDDVDQGAANPWGVACSPDGKYICVAHSGTHEVSVIDKETLFDKLSKVPEIGDQAKDAAAPYNSVSSYDPANDLSFLTGIRKRVALKGNSPRGLCIIGNTVYTTEYISDSIGSFDINIDGRMDSTSTPLGPVKSMDQVRLGEMFFWDAGLCFQKWQSCATCHPDVRADAVNWDLLNDGIGNPKNTKSLVLAHLTPPAMITGIRASAEVAVRAGMKYIQFSSPDPVKASAIDAYLKSLRPTPSPFLVKGRLSKSAQRGEKYFDGAGCETCHSGKYRTDMQKHNVGTGDGMEQGTEFDTPTLLESWRTAPYLYDGRAATMKDIFTKFNKHDEHGVTSNLNSKELDDLVEYVKSL